MILIDDSAEKIQLLAPAIEQMLQSGMMAVSDVGIRRIGNERGHCGQDPIQIVDTALAEATLRAASGWPRAGRGACSAGTGPFEIGQPDAPAVARRPWLSRFRFARSERSGPWASSRAREHAGWGR